jgi:hypothetical protein
MARRFLLVDGGRRVLVGMAALPQAGVLSEISCVLAVVSDKLKLLSIGYFSWGGGRHARFLYLSAFHFSCVIFCIV